MTEPQAPAGPSAASNRLKMPEGVSSTGPYQDMTEAYVKSVIAIPEALENITSVLEEISDFMRVLAIYFGKKGLAEGTLVESDLEEEAPDGPVKTD